VGEKKKLHIRAITCYHFWLWAGNPEMFMNKERALPSKKKRKKICMISKLPYLSQADRSEK